MTDFSEFAQKMGSVLMEGSSTSTFVRTLFEAIIPEDRHYLLDKSQSSFKSYYNGNVNITALAKKINMCVQIKSFELFIKDSGETAVRKLCEVFTDTMPEINESNIGRMLAEYFDKIITEAASVKKKQSKGLCAKNAQDKKEPGNVNNERLLVGIEGGKMRSVSQVSISQNRNAENQNSDVRKNISVIEHVDQVIIHTNQSAETISNFVRKANTHYSGEPSDVVLNPKDSPIHCADTPILDPGRKNGNYAADEMQINQYFDIDYYQLIVTDDPDAFVMDRSSNTIVVTMPDGCFFDYDAFDFQLSYVFTDVNVERLKMYPAILCKKMECNTNTNTDQMALYGYVKRIKKLKCGSRIMFKVIKPFPQSKLYDKKTSIFFDLDVESEVDFFNRNSWSVHKVNLLEAFGEAGIVDMPRLASVGGGCYY